MKKLSACVQLAFCCAALLPAAEAHAQLEGTLFTSPEERTYLDYLRSEFLRTNAENDFNIEETDIPEIPEATTAAPAGPVEYSFGGAMSGRDGVRVWLNGQLLGEAQLPEGFSVVQSGRSFSLRIVNEGKTYLLLPGQTVDVTAGTVVENFQRPGVVAPAVPAAATEPAAEAASVEVATDAGRATEGQESSAGTAQAGDAAARRDVDTTLFGNDAQIDDAVAGLSDEEAAQLAAALERRQAAPAAGQEAPPPVEADAP